MNAIVSDRPRQRLWKVAHGRSLSLGETSRIMAIVNVTPDSFSDGGRLTTVDAALAFARTALSEGADILDIGGESTRPGAAVVSAEEEQARVLPVVAALARQTQALISVDTYRAETARLALAAGAHIVNDVSGLQGDGDMARLAAETGAGLCIMHTGRHREKLADPLEDQHVFLSRSLEIAEAAGVARDCIVLDPGFGFAKTTEENLALMARFSSLAELDLPLLVGTSRKRFLGAVTGHEDPQARDVATAASSALLRLAGADIVRVHNVAFSRDALALTDAILAAGRQTCPGGTP